MGEIIRYVYVIFAEELGRIKVSGSWEPLCAGCRDRIRKGGAADRIYRPWQHIKERKKQ